MIHRPSSITITGAVLLSLGIMSGWGIISTARVLTETYGWSGMFSRDGALFMFRAASSAIELVAGANILRGKNWARVLWTCWYILDLGLKFFLSIETPIPFQLAQLAFIFFLFRPEAHAFFETD
jgi:hypothetical protein